MAERYYWIICKDPDTNKPYLIAGGDTEMSARQKGLESLSGIDFEVRELPTRDLSRASSMIRGKRLEDTRSLGIAKERLGHDRSLKRAVRKRQRRMARDVY